jgi:hypothetical protein
MPSTVPTTTVEHTSAQQMMIAKLADIRPIIIPSTTPTTTHAARQSKTTTSASAPDSDSDDGCR